MAEPPLWAVAMTPHTVGSGVVSKSIPMVHVGGGVEPPVLVLTADDDDEVVDEMGVVDETFVVLDEAGDVVLDAFEVVVLVGAAAEELPCKH